MGAEGHEERYRKTLKGGDFSKDLLGGVWGSWLEAECPSDLWPTHLLQRTTRVQPHVDMAVSPSYTCLYVYGVSPLLSSCKPLGLHLPGVGWGAGEGRPRGARFKLPGISWNPLACHSGATGGLLGAVPVLDSAGIIFRLADGGGGGCRWYY